MVEIQEKYGTTSLIISHDINCIKITADRMVILINGRCYADGTFDELKDSTDIKINQFFQ